MNKKNLQKKGNTIHKAKIRVIGIGGGAENIISEIHSKIKNVDFVLADTKALKGKKTDIRKVYFGESTTKGFGTGMNPELGELSAQGDKKKIEEIFLNQDICIIISCLGGGAGSGAMPVFAKIAKSMNVLTYGIFTLPFNFEGERKKGFASESIEKGMPYLNSYSLILNEKIFEIGNKEMPIKEALSSINKKLAENLEGLISTIYSPGLINIDFADLKAILGGKGRKAFLNSVELDRNNLEKELNKITYDPFSPHELKEAKGVLYNISGGENLELREVSLISKTISSLSSKKVKTIFGISNSKTEKIRTTLLAISSDEEKIKPKKKKEKRKNGIEVKEEEEKKEKEFNEDPFETPAILRSFNNES